MVKILDSNFVRNFRQKVIVYVFFEFCLDFHLFSIKLPCNTDDSKF